MIELYKKKCESCNSKTPKLKQTEIKKYIQELKDWKINDNYEMIYKKYKFKNFMLALDFVNKIGILSEKESHHPDISFGYGYCLILIHTHAIKGLSINDFVLASKIDNIH